MLMCQVIVYSTEHDMQSRFMSFPKQSSSKWYSLYNNGVRSNSPVSTNKLVESSILLRGHPPLDLSIVEVTFFFSSLGINRIEWRHTGVGIRVRRWVVSLENWDSITELLAIGWKVRFLNLGGDHLAETMIMDCLLVVSAWKEACQVKIMRCGLG